MRRAARPDHSGRLALLDNRRPLDGLVHRQTIMIVDRRRRRSAELMKVDLAVSFEGIGDIGLMRPGDLILFTTRAQTPSDHLDGGCNSTSEQLAIELIKIVEQLLQELTLRQAAVWELDGDLVALSDM